MTDTFDIALIDTHNLYARYKYTLSWMRRESDGRHTGGLFGFFKHVDNIRQKRGALPVLAIENGGRDVRLALDENYKADRKNDEPFFVEDDHSLIMEWARHSGYGVLIAEGTEADDTIANMCEKSSCSILIVSNDHDFHALLSIDGVAIEKQRGEIMRRLDFVDKHGYDPSMYRDILAIAGDSSDNIAGVKGIGPKTAARMLQDNGSLDLALINEDRLKGHEEMIRRNRILVQPLECDVRMDISERCQEEIDRMYKELEFNL